MYYFLVAPTILVRATSDSYTYHSDTPLPIGSIVRISIGKKEATGVIISSVASKPTFATKPIITALTDQPLPPQMLTLNTWMSTYYSTHLSIVLQTTLPSGLHKKRRSQYAPLVAPMHSRTKMLLNDAQRKALNTIIEHPSGTILLHGVTGSGKTQVYIQAAKHHMTKGRSSLILIPEIALTPQLVAEFQSHFSEIVITHSRMTEAERHKAWLHVLNASQPVIVIGPRSALFMPVRDIGLIVIDEAHEPSYKQDQSPRYSAIRTASVLAKAHRATVVLGSATPSINDYFLAEHTDSPIVTLSTSAKQSVAPTITVVDLRRKENFREHRFLSDALLTNMRQAINDRVQVLLFHNRRGTTPISLCSGCGWSALCQTCYVPLVLHADHHKLICHMCGRTEPVPPSCPICHSATIIFKGIGTKLIETEVRKAFPKATIARFDADNTATETLEQRYQEVYNGDIDILIGTQILAKGLDAPKLGVVGVIQADSGLHLPDYQAEERVFQLLYQVAGRVGRGHQAMNEVIVQTYTPDHPSIQAALARNYHTFYNQQLASRKAHRFPPFTHLLKLTTSHKTEAGAIRAARALHKQLRQTHPALTILGPTPAFYERLHGHYRWQLLLKSSSRAALATIATQVPVGWQTDLDPSNLL